MGEVYRATDCNLKRSVAIKVLPAAVAGDADRLVRFQREAEVLAALNHPNIGAIYGLEKTPDFTALVMELVEGEDLSQRIARGAMAIDEALSIAKQIAEALEAAHERGIVHRDLKPANIKVRPDGTAKVLDFGLAKAMDVRSSGSSSAGGPGGPSMSPTISIHAAQAGIILGTAAYMAPEQARGKSVDKRADIWAFGCVLYEMLTGRTAFPDPQPPIRSPLSSSASRAGRPCRPRHRRSGFGCCDDVWRKTSASGCTTSPMRAGSRRRRRSLAARRRGCASAQAPSMDDRGRVDTRGGRHRCRNLGVLARETHGNRRAAAIHDLARVR